MFQSTLPVKGATGGDNLHETRPTFQSTLPVKGATHTLKGDAAREDRMPELRDLGWSRDAEYDADTVIATRIKDGKAAAALLKNREGEAGNGRTETRWRGAWAQG